MAEEFPKQNLHAGDLATIVEVARMIGFADPDLQPIDRGVISAFTGMIDYPSGPAGNAKLAIACEPSPPESLDPWMAHLTEPLEGLGFFFSGILPGSFRTAMPSPCIS